MSGDQKIVGIRPNYYVHVINVVCLLIYQYIKPASLLLDVDFLINAQPKHPSFT